MHFTGYVEFDDTIEIDIIIDSNTTKLILLDSLLQEIDNDAFETLKFISDFILMLLY